MYKGDIVSALNTLVPISLNEIGNAKLMNRFETKYILSAGRVAELIYRIKGRFKVLEINNMRVHPYRTTYLDTADNLFFNQHIRGELERNKIRYRKYESSGNIFLEIKKKNNKGRICKWRIENNPGAESFDDIAIEFLDKHISLNSNLLKPILINNFTRATLTGYDLKERITIDYDISFSETDISGKRLYLPYLSIIEVKKEGIAHRSEFQSLLKQQNIRPSGFSKYCFGNAMLNESLKEICSKQKYYS